MVTKPSLEQGLTRSLHASLALSEALRGTRYHPSALPISGRFSQSLGVYSEISSFWIQVINLESRCSLCLRKRKFWVIGWVRENLKIWPHILQNEEGQSWNSHKFYICYQTQKTLAQRFQNTRRNHNKEERLEIGHKHRETIRQSRESRFILHFFKIWWFLMPDSWFQNLRGSSQQMTPESHWFWELFYHSVKVW